MAAAERAAAAVTTEQMAQKLEDAGHAVLDALQRHLPDQPLLWMSVLGGIVASTAAASGDVSSATNALMHALECAAEDIAQGEPS